ncbi:hypothetical protein B0O99DRAFT_694352 [Bisporella sp. PMI_857]|nr:hypothetical protein B0O99DRAFT_694352 [Bisporella sp. PMI_857]
MPLHYPDWLSWYKKPNYVEFKEFADKKARPQTPNSSSPRASIDSRASRDIPSKLNLEKILKNQTCSPMSLYDFHMYLKHIEHSAENLEFFVWFKNFEAGRLTGNISRPQSKSSQSHDFGFPSDKSSVVERDDKSFNISVTESQENLNFQHADMYAQISSLVDQGCAKHCAPRKDKRSKSCPDDEDSAGVEVAVLNLSELVSDNEQARRTELDTIKCLFLIPGAPKELNIPSTMRQKVLEDISTSTSAANLKPVADHVYMLLKNCSHRNFLRLGVGNGTFETLCMATGLGIVLTVTGVLAMLLLAFASPSIHHCNRWRALGLWPMWTIGVGLILSGMRGSCFFLLLFSRRQRLPWEHFDDDASTIAKKKNKLLRFFSKLMIFDRKVKVKDDNLRYLQRKIVLQSCLGGVLFATMMEIFFLALPIWAPLR